MIEPSLIGDTKVVSIFTKAFPQEFKPAILAEVNRSIEALYTRIVTGSGKLAPWVGSEVASGDDFIKGRVYSNAKQAAVFEYGAPRNGAFRVREHERRLAHLWGRAISPIKITVPTYSRIANIVARPAFIPALEGMKAEIVENLRKATDRAAANVEADMK